MLKMTAKVGDGVILNFWPQGALPKIIRYIKIAVKRADKNPEDVEVVSAATVLVTDDKVFGREMFRRPLYGNTPHQSIIVFAPGQDMKRPQPQYAKVGQVKTARIQIRSASNFKPQ
jgi:alkanesulfonate monooxygenase SsuD/methylene tetrahydromethanopterin reductase-like flavin-dependent oxidoreductase (luciferase family)